MSMSMLPTRSDFAGLIPAVHGGGDAGGGGLPDLLNTLLEGFSGMTEPGGLGGLFAGIVTLGYNVHPMVVHFPIAFLLGFLFVEMLAAVRQSQAMAQVASGLLYLGALGAVLAATAGIVAEHTVPHGEAVHDIMERHEWLGLSVTSLSIILAFWRYVGGSTLMGMSRGMHWFIACVMAVCLFFGADLGGLMVYQHGVGVQSLQNVTDAHEHAEPSDKHHHAHEH